MNNFILNIHEYQIFRRRNSKSKKSMFFFYYVIVILGISYLSTSEELKLREDLEEKNTYDREVLSAKCNESDAKVSKEPLIAIPSENAKQIEEIW